VTAIKEMPRVQECTVEQCSYNHDGCRAFAITIGSMEHAHCTTFIDISVQGGLEKVIAQVGACQRADCRHNDNLECHAPAIRVAPGRDQADCMTYDPV
jgi:hypothetical protein